MDQCVVVTGAGRGLGYHVVRRHLKEHDRVYAYDYQLTGELEKLAGDNPLLSIYECDIASTASVASAMAGILSKEVRVDILYNIAAIYRFEDRVGLTGTDLDSAAHMFSVNSVGALRVCKALWGKLQTGTLVLNISSEAGSIGTCRRTTLYAYCMSKAALNMASKILSNELWPTGARVMNIHPGYMRTFMGGEAALQSKDSVSPQESADNIVNIAQHMDEIPRDVLFMQHTGEIMPW